MQYFVIAISYGRRGVEAIVDPEITKRGVIERIASGEYPRDLIVFAHEVNDFGDGHMVVSDVKDELIEAAGLPEPNVREIDLTVAKWDHDHDLRKHGEPV